MPKSYNTYFLAIVATIGGMLFGFDISSLSAIVGTQQYINYFHDPNNVKQGAIGSALAAGSVIGAVMAGPVSDKIGRRDACAFACLWWLVGTAVQTSTHSIGQLIAGRMINGVCVGITSSQVPVYLAEIAKKEQRGSIVVIQQLAIEFGILIMFFIGYGCSFIGDDYSTGSFRTAFGLQYIPAILLLIGLPFLPRSPRWLAKVGRTDEAIDILARIQAHGDKTDPLVMAEWEEITTALELEQNSGPWYDKFFKNGMWRRTFAGASVQAWQQLSGANVMTYYVVYVFYMAGLTGNANLISSGVQYAAFIIFTTVTFFFIDKTGRRPLLIYGAIAMGVCHFVVGGVLGSYGEHVDSIDNNGNIKVTIENNQGAAHTVIAFSYLLIIAYALTLAPVAWVYASEVWSLETRAYGMGLASIANWVSSSSPHDTRTEFFRLTLAQLFNFALGFFLPPAFHNISWKTFLIFGTLCFGAAAQAYVSYPETACKSLEEIEEMFRPGAPPPWKTKVGGSRLDAHIEEVANAQRHGSITYSEKGEVVHIDREKKGEVTP